MTTSMKDRYGMLCDVVKDVKKNSTEDQEFLSNEKCIFTSSKRDCMPISLLTSVN